MTPESSVWFRGKFPESPRGASRARLTDSETVCFMCGLERSTFDRHGHSFTEHTRRDHHVWDYLALLVYLRKTPATELNGWESFIATKLPDGRNDSGDISFFPMNRAIALQELDGGGGRRGASRE